MSVVDDINLLGSRVRVAVRDIALHTCVCRDRITRSCPPELPGLIIWRLHL